MDTKTIFDIIGTMYIIVSSVYFLTHFDFDILNPKYNYKKWKSLNWFGVSVCTLIINIVFFFVAIIYWICIFIYTLFTIGRK